MNTNFRNKHLTCMICIVFGLLISPLTANKIILILSNSRASLRCSILGACIIISVLLANDLHNRSKRNYTPKKQPFPSTLILKDYSSTLSPSSSIQNNDFLSVLTPQETVLVELILRGYTGVSIAKLMNISVETQKSYRKSAYNKLAIHSKEELFHLAHNRI